VSWAFQQDNPTALSLEKMAARIHATHVHRILQIDESPGKNHEIALASTVSHGAFAAKFLYAEQALIISDLSKNLTIFTATHMLKFWSKLKR
jgi:hypothetical protein